MQSNHTTMSPKHSTDSKASPNNTNLTTAPQFHEMKVSSIGSLPSRDQPPYATFFTAAGDILVCDRSENIYRFSARQPDSKQVSTTPAELISQINIPALKSNSTFVEDIRLTHLHFEQLPDRTILRSSPSAPMSSVLINPTGQIETYCTYEQIDPLSLKSSENFSSNFKEINETHSIFELTRDDNQSFALIPKNQVKNYLKNNLSACEDLATLNLGIVLPEITPPVLLPNEQVIGYTIPRENILVVLLKNFDFSYSALAVYELANQSLHLITRVNLPGYTTFVDTLARDWIVVTHPGTNIDDLKVQINIYNLADIFNEHTESKPFFTKTFRHPEVRRIDKVMLGHNGRTLYCTGPLFSRQKYDAHNPNEAKGRFIKLRYNPPTLAGDLTETHDRSLVRINMDMKADTNEQDTFSFQKVRAQKDAVTLTPEGDFCVAGKTEKGDELQIMSSPWDRAWVNEIFKQVDENLVASVPQVKSLIAEYLFFGGLFAKRKPIISPSPRIEMDADQNQTENQTAISTIKK
jgi:hypothetical protein